jgi:hypothetical protein
MTGEPQAAEQPSDGLDWKRLAQACGLALLLRGGMLVGTFVFGFLCFAESWPLVARVLALLPPAAAAALGAYYVYPRMAWLAALIVALLPPDRWLVGVGGLEGTIAGTAMAWGPLLAYAMLLWRRYRSPDSSEPAPDAACRPQSTLGRVARRVPPEAIPLLAIAAVYGTFVCYRLLLSVGVSWWR